MMNLRYWCDRLLNTKRVVFLVNDYFVNNFISVYREMKESFHFHPIIIATDFIELDGTIKNSASDVCSFMKKNGIKCVNSNKSGTYLDLEKIKPEYVFYMTPYDCYFPTAYDSKLVKEYSKVCHISYGTNVIEYTGIYEYATKNPFFENSTYIFVEGNSESYVAPIKEKAKEVGLVKLDDYFHYGKKDLLQQKNKRFKVVWKPRWTLIEEDSNFWKYAETYLLLIKKHPEIDFYIFFHQLFDRKIKELDFIEQYANYLKRLRENHNYYECDYSDFLDDVLTCDLFITDYSSTMVEYGVTGKPMIYCDNESVNLNALGKKVADNSYKIKNEAELIDVFEQLVNGIDPMKKQREKAAKTYVYVPKKGSSAKEVLKYLK